MTEIDKDAVPSLHAPQIIDELLKENKRLRELLDKYENKPCDVHGNTRREVREYYAAK